jgi:hypothetical protein
MFRYLVFLYFLLSAGAIFAQDTLVVKPSASLVVWQGFQQNWGYNHRLNRMGDYVDNINTETDPPEVDLVHTAATGIGMDTCSIEAYYTYLKARNIGVSTGDISMQLIGFKGVPIKVSEEISIPVAADFDKTSKLEVLLNGFDIYSNAAAQKLQSFSIVLTDPVYIDSSREVRFTANVEVTLDCRSLECPKFNPKVDYRMHVFYLLLANKDMKVSHHNYQQASVWDKKEELEVTSVKDTLKGIAGNLYPAAVAGFKELLVHLDNEHWMLDWQSYLEPIKYDSKSGQYIVARNLLFKQWAEKMKKSSEKKYESVFAERRPGAAAFAGKLSLIQFKDACTQQGQVSGNIKWRGKNLSPDQPNAVTVKSLQVDALGCEKVK